MASYPLFSNGTEVMGNSPIARKVPLLSALLKKYPNGVGSNFIRYLCLTYDKQSPFKAEFHSLGERKAAVAAFCNFKENDEEQYYKWLVELSNEHVVDALCDLLKFQNDLTWSMIVQYEEVFLNNQRQIFVGISQDNVDKDRITASLNASKLADVNDKLADKIAALYVKFTGNDPDAVVAIKERRPLSPETVADFTYSSDYNPAFLNEEEE